MANQELFYWYRSIHPNEGQRRLPAHTGGEEGALQNISALARAVRPVGSALRICDLRRDWRQHSDIAPVESPQPVHRLAVPPHGDAIVERVRRRTSILEYNIQCSEIFTLRNEKLHTEA